MLTYAIGDVHGDMALLAKLLVMIDKDAKGAEHRLVFLGDYVDRGENSYGVVQTLRQLRKERGDQVVVLKGNHEDMMVQAMLQLKREHLLSEHEHVIAMWLGNGGQETLDQYLKYEPHQIDTHLMFMHGLPTKFETEHHFFCHAGVQPGYPLSAQPDAVLLWTRDWWANRWTGEPIPQEKHIVYGHTPTRDGLPRVYPDSTCLDTGAFFSGVMTAGVFDTSKPGGPERFLQARLKA